MMLYPAINELNEKTDSRYTLVVLAAKRARDIVSGKPVLTEVEAERPVSLATNEIAEERITYRRVVPVDAPEEAAEAEASEAETVEAEAAEEEAPVAEAEGVEEEAVAPVDEN